MRTTARRLFRSSAPVLALACACAPPPASIERLGAAARSSGSDPARPSEQVIEIGHSVEGRPIRLHVFGAGEETLLVFGGFHGNEPTSADLADSLMELLRADPSVAAGRRVAIVPRVNPDGLARGARTNSRGVDINRNLPASNWSPRGPGRSFSPGPSPASEPETQAVLSAVEQMRPSRILSIHSIARGRHCVNYDGPAADLARRMSVANGYPVRPTMGYETRGSFGTWAGVDRNIPTITLELPRDADAAQCWAENRDALLAFLR